ncbi:hypothetical protein M8J75_003374 [Diaphorina citri]|nr:hypothetical protein M8J75_003374 [Diaphorina citri]
MGIGVQKVIRSREGLRIEVAKTENTKAKLEVLSRELKNHGYSTKSLEEHRLPRVAILGADPATAADDVLLAVSSQLSVPTGEIHCHHSYKTKEGSIKWVLEISRLFSEAYLKAATPTTAINGFKHCGIVPLNPEVYGDDEFAPAEATDQPQEEESAPDNPDPVEIESDDPDDPDAIRVAPEDPDAIL